MEVTFFAGAEADLFAAWVRYEELLPGWGTVSRPKYGRTWPESAPIYAGEFRRLLVRRFEHGIFYRIHGARIVVTAVLDLRQDPAKIRERLDP